MKVGADGVTLGAWADVSGAKSILDAGCGSGLITLMLAQRSEAKITAIDIDEQSIVQTKENVGNSLWDNQQRSYHKATCCHGDNRAPASAASHQADDQRSQAKPDQHLQVEEDGGWTQLVRVDDLP